jgi:hypothetical protein
VARPTDNPAKGQGEGKTKYKTSKENQGTPQVAEELKKTTSLTAETMPL